MYYIQNKGDEYHILRHYKPFVEAFKKSGNAERLRVITTNQGAGHRTPKPEVFREYIEKSIADA